MGSDEQTVTSELESRARARGEKLDSPFVRERISVGVNWELHEKHRYHKVIYNPKGQVDRAAKELKDWFAAHPKQLTIVSGASFVGKGTLLDPLLKGKPRRRRRKGKLTPARKVVRKMVLFTTRQKRRGERSGKQYIFTSLEKLREMAAKGTHVIFPVYVEETTWIGLEIEGLTRAIKDHKSRWVLETIPEMAKVIQAMFPELVQTVFISCVPEETGVHQRLTEEYAFRGENSIGIAFSSNSAVLQEAAEQIRRSPNMAFDSAALEQIARSASGRESLRANGKRIGSGDVYAIVHGGVGLIHTSEGQARFEELDHDSKWIEEHLLWAHLEQPKTHDAKKTLAGLFENKRNARKHVRRISATALQAGAALETLDEDKLADAINSYVGEFKEWVGAQLIDEAVQEMSVRLTHGLGGNLLAFKPLGAGHAESMCVLVRDSDVAKACEHIFQKSAWVSHRVRVTYGLDRRDYGTRHIISAPYRLDLVAAADLSIDPAIGCDGVCCAIAIGPRSTVTLEQTGA